MTLIFNLKIFPCVSAEKCGGSSYNMNNKYSPGSTVFNPRSGDHKYVPNSSSVNMNMPNGAVSNINTGSCPPTFHLPFSNYFHKFPGFLNILHFYFPGSYCGNMSRMPHLSKVNFEREVQRRFTNKRENMSRAERYEIEKRINKPLDLKYQ